MHLVIYFCGTDNPGQSFLEGYDYLPQDTPVRTLMVKGCHDPQVCNAVVNPDLRGFAKRFTKNLFRQNNSRDLVLATATPSDLGIGVEDMLKRRQLEKFALAELDLIDDKLRYMPLKMREQYNRTELWRLAKKDKVQRAQAAKKIKTLITDEERAKIEKEARLTEAEKDDVVRKWGISTEQAQQPITSISLVGYSRGAVTTFEVAQQLEKIAPNIPLEIDIVGDQPVPGNVYALPGSNAARVADCRNLSRVKNVGLTLAAYTGRKVEPGQKGIDQDHVREKTNSIHRAGYSQVVPKMPLGANREIAVIPRDTHWDDRPHGLGEKGEYLHLQLAKVLQRRGYVSEQEVQRKAEQIQKIYGSEAQAARFPPMSQVQGIFGMSAKEAYKHLDPLHPAAGLRRGMSWNPNEPLIDWWIKQDKKASSFSTDLTKELVKLIQATNKNNPEQLFQLWKKADEWLILKVDSNSSRFEQVEALRNNIEHHLIYKKQFDKSLFLAHNREHLDKNNYFLNHWNKASSAASRFKTEATRELDAAFAAYAKEKPGLERDHKLRDALDKWLDVKKDSSSSRYDLVVSIREQLDEVIKKGYKVEAELKLSAEPKPSDEQDKSYPAPSM